MLHKCKSYPFTMNGFIGWTSLLVFVILLGFVCAVIATEMVHENLCKQWKRDSGQVAVVLRSNCTLTSDNWILIYFWLFRLYVSMRCANYVCWLYDLRFSDT